MVDSEKLLKIPSILFRLLSVTHIQGTPLISQFWAPEGAEKTNLGILMMDHPQGVVQIHRKQQSGLNLGYKRIHNVKNPLWTHLYPKYGP